MDLELIKSVDAAVKQSDDKMLEQIRLQEEELNEVKEYVKTHGKPLKTYLEEYGFEPRSAADVARLSGGLPKNPTLSPKAAGAVTDPGKGAMLRRDDTEWRREHGDDQTFAPATKRVQPGQPDIGHVVMVKSPAGTARYKIVDLDKNTYTLEIIPPNDTSRMANFDKIPKEVVVNRMSDYILKSKMAPDTWTVDKTIVPGKV